MKHADIILNDVLESIRKCQKEIDSLEKRQFEYLDRIANFQEHIERQNDRLEAYECLRKKLFEVSANED